MYFSLQGLVGLLWFAFLRPSFSTAYRPVAERGAYPDQYQESHKQGAAASESAVCSRIGVDLIRDGGNAADAVGKTITDWR